MKIEEIINFPRYQQGTEEDSGENLKGPYAGGDIAVYRITSASKKKAKKSMKEGSLAPACLPQKGYKGERGIFASWLDQEPFYRLSTIDIRDYEREYLSIRKVEV